MLITLREGLEAALIVGIVLAYLARCGQGERRKTVWFGVAAGVLVSVIAGAIITVTAGSLDGRAEEIFEGAALLLAGCVMTWMIFWMRRRARHIRLELEAEVNKALRSDSHLALGLLVFVAVAREGVETVLFLFASSQTASPASILVGGMLGLGIAGALGVLLYQGVRVLNLRTFFNITGLLLILFAAGVLARGIHELQEAAVVPLFIGAVWDFNPLLDETSVLGQFLTSLFGYNGNPSLVEAGAYLVYLVSVLFFFFRPYVPRAQLAIDRPR